jgi:hypothetical protein
MRGELDTTVNVRRPSQLEVRHHCLHPPTLHALPTGGTTGDAPYMPAKLITGKQQQQAYVLQCRGHRHVLTLHPLLPGSDAVDNCLRGRCTSIPESQCLAGRAVRSNLGTALPLSVLT